MVDIGPNIGEEGQHNGPSHRILQSCHYSILWVMYIVLHENVYLHVHESISEHLHRINEHRHEYKGGSILNFFFENMLFAPPTSCVGQTQSQAAAESGYCLLNIAVESSTSRAGSSVVEESEVTSVKTSYSPALNQQSRLTV